MNAALADTQNRNFNSIKVRLERGLNPLWRYLGISFQFHKGAIRTAIGIGRSTYYRISIP